MSNQYQQNTILYYDKMAASYFAETKDLDLSHLYKMFEPYLEPQSSILDAGCGSGRDSLYFKKRGYQVTAFDASKELSSKAEMLSGVPVLTKSFHKLKLNQQFDAIWACASLLHVPLDEMPETFSGLLSYLKPGGVCFVSFKYGTGEQLHGERWYSYHNEATFAEFINDINFCKILFMWSGRDTRPSLTDQVWLNAIIRKM